MRSSVKLAERPRQPIDRVATTAERSTQRTGPGELGLSLIEIDDSNAHRFDIPAGMTGLLVQRVEPLSVAYDGGIERGSIILEINRQPVELDRRLPPHRRRGAAGRRPRRVSLRARARSARDPHRPHGVSVKPRILVIDDEVGDPQVVEG